MERTQIFVVMKTQPVTIDESYENIGRQKIEPKDFTRACATFTDRCSYENPGSRYNQQISHEQV